MSGETINPLSCRLRPLPPVAHCYSTTPPPPPLTRRTPAATNRAPRSLH